MSTADNEKEDIWDTGWVKKSAFPSFALLFGRRGKKDLPMWLTLLGLCTPDSFLGIKAVRAAIAVSPDPLAEVVALLTDNRRLRYMTGWRQHLVGAVAVVAGVSDEQAVRAIWESFDAGSWVSPQLAVAAFYSDPNFESEARRRIESGCPKVRELVRKVNREWELPEKFADEHSTEIYWSCKSMSAIIALVRQLPGTDDWLEQAQADARIQKILAVNDEDHGDRIALGWQTGIREAVKLAEMPFWKFPALQWKRFCKYS